jgi:2-methylcitrate dehydratase PrpD
MEYLQEMGGPPRARVWGKDFKTSSPLAALANGIFGHALDYDDLNRSMRGHPTVPLLPAVFAIGEEVGASGGEVLAAYLVGFEVETKLGATLDPHLFEAGWHCTAVLGVMGAASAAAKLLKLHPEKICMALGLAASQACGLRRNFGTMAKPWHAGQAAMNGVVAAKLAQKGFTSDPEIIEGTQGYAYVFVGPGKANFQRILDSMGRPFDIISPGVALKSYPSCARTHPAIDAMLELAEGNEIRAEEVEAIISWGSYTTPQVLIHSRPRTGLEGKFSLEFCLALAFLEKKVELPQFTDEKVQNPKVQEVMQKVSFRIRPDLQNIESSGNHSATLEIRMKDGRIFSNRKDEAKGSPGNPLTPDEIREKYRSCVRGLQSAALAEETIQAVADLENLPEISRLINLLSGSKEYNL